MKRIVLDTNVTISALFWKGHPRALFDLVREGKAALLSCGAIEAELIKVLSYSRFGLAPGEILPIVSHVRKYAYFVKITSRLDVIKQDPDDNVFIECALDGQADYIVSGDHHLLDLANFKGIQIVRSKDFLRMEGFI